MKKIFLGLLLSFVMLFAAIDFNKVSKQELMNIKGIGEKKAQSIIDYRKKNKINSVDDLQKIKGFGEKLVNKIKKSTKS
ncbi:DNA-binding protein [Malaciobacter molluscorum LMG 25693]|uniref:Competence protein, ComEA family n=1 Tax=Malaciobacter molluscorum LMG 25693 TaxID=870501 RepID=A0A2G1DHG9_9BACT|nr:helix-hairpin-helix domain-containing protein [Malaciobacter molluscorum]AXX93662.1 competence protein, ComEA family [Malaciobacter molluscorum LMG 25693]PHO17927.1 DNA-binding protein [Malaciobacter molluscorum LMG 25693]